MRTSIICALALAFALACPSFAADTWFEVQQSNVGVVVYSDTSIQAANAMHVAVQYRAPGEQAKVTSTLVMRGPMGTVGYSAICAFAVPSGSIIETVQVVPVTLHLPGAIQQQPAMNVRY